MTSITDYDHIGERDRHANFTTYRMNWPRDQFVENLQNTLNLSINVNLPPSLFYKLIQNGFFKMFKIVLL